MKTERKSRVVPLDAVHPRFDFEDADGIERRIGSGKRVRFFGELSGLESY